MALQSINPATGETLQTFDTLGPAEVMARLERAAVAFRAWKDTQFSERARLLLRAAAILEAESETLGRLMTLEMGKPVRAGIDEAVKCARGYEFLDRFVAAMSALRVGDPMDASTDVGPLATPDLVSDLEAQVRATVAAGARVVTGGTRLPGPGNYFAPTVLVDIPPGSPAYRDELFGPVAAAFRVPSADAAIGLANDSAFGLGASVWTNEDAERERFVRELEAGQVFVNAMVVSDPRLPFGGVKRSGYGRELGVHGIREFVNVKTVWVAD